MGVTILDHMILTTSWWSLGESGQEATRTSQDVLVRSLWYSQAEFGNHGARVWIQVLVVFCLGYTIGSQTCVPWVTCVLQDPEK